MYLEPPSRQKKRIAPSTTCKVKCNPCLGQQVGILRQYPGRPLNRRSSLCMLSIPFLPGSLVYHVDSYLRQNAGVSTTRSVKISRRPNNIPRHNTHLLNPLMPV